MVRLHPRLPSAPPARPRGASGGRRSSVGVNPWVATACISLFWGADKRADIFIDNVHIELSLWDTAGQEEFDRLRSLSYDNTDVVVLCFSVDSKDSLENVESKWVGEIQENCPGVKLVLVALKCDLREGSEEEDDAAASGAEGGAQREKKPMIGYDQGLEVARRIKALRYLECSAMRNRGVNEAFTEAARVALSVKPSGEKDSKCSVM